MRTLTSTTLAIVFLMGMGLTAQAPKPRGSASATAVAPATNQTAPAKAEATPVAGKIMIGGEIPSTIENTRNYTFNLNVKGGTAPYTWENAEGIGEGSPTAKLTLSPEKEGDWEVIIKVTDSSTPPLTTERKVTIVVTPRVATMGDIEEELQNKATLSSVNAVAAKIESISSTMTTAGGANKQFEELKTQIQYLMYAIGAGFVLLLIVFVLVVANFTTKYKWIASNVTWIAKNTKQVPEQKEGTQHFKPSNSAILLFAVSLGASMMLTTKPMYAATGGAPAVCAIRSVNPATIVKEQDAVLVTIQTRACAEIKSVDLAVADASVTFTDFAVDKNGKITVKVVAGAPALTGPAAFKIVLGDGTEVKSADAMPLLILDTATAQIRHESATAIATARAATEKQIKVLEAKITGMEAKLASFATSADVDRLLAPVRITANNAAKQTELDVVRFTANNAATTASLRAVADDLGSVADRTTAIEKGNIVRDQNDIVLVGHITSLATIQSRLAETEVKKGVFGGKKPLNPEVAAAAKEILKQLRGEK